MHGVERVQTNRTFTSSYEYYERSDDSSTKFCCLGFFRHCRRFSSIEEFDRSNWREERVKGTYEVTTLLNK